jgi:hypothetical protein
VYHIDTPRSTDRLTPFADNCFMYAAVQTSIGRRRIINWFTPLRCRERQKSGDQFRSMTYRFLCLRREYKMASIA